MLTRGQPPYLECSSKGDKRFSAFWARPTSLCGVSIEEAYQAMKIFPDGATGLSWREAKGKKAINHKECKEAYEQWWTEWVKERNLLKILKRASGLSDLFGKEGQVCQAEVLWRIRNGEL
jgi:sulfatase maturation enzyme AslB (radical SAM superfamily)